MLNSHFLQYALFSPSFSHIPFHSLLKPLISKLLLLKYFWTQQKNWIQRAEERKKGYIPPDVKVYQQAGGMAMSAWKGFLKCMHTISITITSNNLQKFVIHVNTWNVRGLCFGAQPVWQRYMRRNKVLGCLLCWRCRKFGNLCKSLTVWTSVQLYSQL